MPGAYLLAILLSAAGVAALDARLRLALWHRPLAAAAAIAVGVVVLLAADVAGIAAGVFVQGDSSLYLGVGLGPQLPLEEPVFLAFLSYLALVAWAGADRILGRLRPRPGGRGSA